MPNCGRTLARGSRPRRVHAPAREQRGGDDEREEASRPYELPDSEHLPGVKQIACTGGRCTIAVPSPEESNSGRRCCALVVALGALAPNAPDDPGKDRLTRAPPAG